MLNINVEGLDDLQRALRSLAADQIPTAMRNAINDTARDVQKREEQEIARVFDRPTRIVQKPFYVRPATKENLSAEVKLKDVYGNQGSAITNTLEPHIPGFSPHRKAKGMESALRRKGLLGPNEYLVPSRTMKLDSNGNVKGSVASKMLSDLWVWSYDDATRNTGSGGSNRKSTYIWGEINTRNGRPIKGIWHRQRFLARKPGALMMLVVQGAPTYAKRFRFFEIGKREIDRVISRHAQLALDAALRRAGFR